MRIVNVIVYVFIIAMLVIGKGGMFKHFSWAQRCRDILEKQGYVLGLLIVTNTISFVMTYTSMEQGLFIERASYGGEPFEQGLLLKQGDAEEEWNLQVNARSLTEEEIQKRTEEAFIHFDHNIKGKNDSLDNVKENLDYSYDYELFPFDVEFVSDNYSILDEEGVIRNAREELLKLGYSSTQIKDGIDIKLVVTLWYNEQSFSREYALTVYEQEHTVAEEAFIEVKELLKKQEQEKGYEKSFYIPTQVGQVEIMPLEEGLTAMQVWIAGVIIAVLLILREKENEKKLLEKRKDCLLRSYSWFVNELLLMMGAGMQVRNIFQLLLRDFEKIEHKSDYRCVLMKEVKVAVQALELGMAEEQVYYKLGRQLGLPCYIKIMTLLEQNVKRGGKGIAELFEQEELQALEQRKNLAKRMGEEAGTKLLGPMILLLLIIMIMIMLPAFWGFA